MMVSFKSRSLHTRSWLWLSCWLQCVFTYYFLAYLIVMHAGGSTADTCTIINIMNIVINDSQSISARIPPTFPPLPKIPIPIYADTAHILIPTMIIDIGWTGKYEIDAMAMMSVSRCMRICTTSTA